MAARHMIQDLETNTKAYETSEKFKKEITDLGLLYGLATRCTSFVGVDKQTKKSFYESSMITHQIDHEVPRYFGAMMSCSLKSSNLTPVKKKCARRNLQFKGKKKI